jgi:hypothetical protein
MLARLKDLHGGATDPDPNLSTSPIRDRLEHVLGELVGFLFGAWCDETFESMYWIIGYLPA